MFCWEKKLHPNIHMDFIPTAATYLNIFVRWTNSLKCSPGLQTPSIHFLYSLNPIQGCSVAGAYLSCQWVKGLLQPGQVANPAQRLQWSGFQNKSWKHEEDFFSISQVVLMLWLTGAFTCRCVYWRKEKELLSCFHANSLCSRPQYFNQKEGRGIWG